MVLCANQMLVSYYIKMHHIIRGHSDWSSFQNVLHMLRKWSYTRHLNITCKKMLLKVGGQYQAISKISWDLFRMKFMFSMLLRVKDLGVITDQRLTFTFHVSNIVIRNHAAHSVFSLDIALFYSAMFATDVGIYLPRHVADVQK